MTGSNVRTSFESIPGAGLVLMRQVVQPVLVGFMLAGVGTSAASALPAELVHQALQPAQQTSAGVSLVAAAHAGAAIAELRRISGFTWDQLARIFSVSRRSLHFWASGKAMTPANEEHLQRLLAVLRKIDRGSASANRRELLAVRDDGTIAFDLLVARQYELVASLVGAGETKPRLAAPKLSARATAMRMPPSPDQLVGALQDSVHRETGPARVGRSVRVKSDG
jgi:DNA-binding transcriptional regulator YiaG